MKRKTKTTKKRAVKSARDVVTLHSVFTDIANAIRAKTGDSDPISPVNMGNAIRNIDGISAATLPASNLPAIFQDIANAIRECGATGTMTVSQMATKIGDLASPRTYVSYTKESGYSNWNGNISGTISGSAAAATDQIPNVQYAESIILGSTITSVGTYAFNACSSLKSISIPDNVTSFGSYAFYKCSGLASISIPSSVSSIGQYALRGCTGLTSIHVDASNQSYCSVSNCLLSKDGTSLIQGSNGDIVLPEGVTSIQSFAFDGFSGLTSITIPSSMTTFGTSTFRNCTSLASIILPQGMSNLGRGSFSGCSSLTSIAIPDSLATITLQQFKGCSSMQSITLGSGIKTISTQSFYNCSNCMLFDFRKSLSVPTLSNVDAFNGTSENKKIVVPDALYNDWIAASNWSSTTNGIVDAITRASDYTA